MIYKVKKWKKFISYLILALWCLIVILALMWVIFTSFKTNKELYQGIWELPESFSPANYEKIWNLYDLSSFFLNSMMIVPINVFFVLLLSVPAAFIFARAKFKLNGLLFNYFILGMGIPVIIAIFPMYFLLMDFKLLNTFTGLSFIYIATSISFSVFILYGFFKSYPSELDDAASIDGCSDFRAFYSIVLPLSTPGIITVIIFNFIGIWNEYLLALIFIKDETKRLLSVGIYALQASMQYTGDWVTLFAGVVLALVPLIIFFILLSDRIMDGLTLGAVKG